MSARSLAARARSGAPIFAALGDETRLRLVARLCEGGPLSIARLTEGEEMTRQAITKHLAVLADAGLVIDVWRGRERLWQLEPAPIVRARQSLDAIGQAWDAALGRLQAHLDADA